MKLGMGKLLWTPATFWASTILEINSAADGLAEFHGIEVESGDSTQQPLSSKEFAALREKLGV